MWPCSGRLLKVGLVQVRAPASQGQHLPCRRLALGPSSRSGWEMPAGRAPPGQSPGAVHSQGLRRGAGPSFLSALFLVAEFPADACWAGGWGRCPTGEVAETAERHPCSGTELSVALFWGLRGLGLAWPGVGKPSCQAWTGCPLSHSSVAGRVSVLGRTWGPASGGKGQTQGPQWHPGLSVPAFLGPPGPGP